MKNRQIPLVTGGLFIFLFAVVLTLSFTLFFPISNTEAATTPTLSSPIPVRKFILDLDANTTDLKTLTSGQKVEGRFKEYPSTQVTPPMNRNETIIKDWKIKIEKKGNSRKICEPLMFNMTFDKFDSSGNKKPLFNGRSTYPGYAGNTTLEYQELRFIPDCDVWNDYALSFDVGFGGALSPHMREGFTHTMFRNFGIATPEIVGFADITFKSADPKYHGKTFRYMILQRADEQDDQVPFTKQFNLKLPVYEENLDGPYYRSDSGSDRLNKIVIMDSLGNIPVNLNLDTVNSSKLLMLSELIGLSDVWFLTNESYATKISDNKTLIIPHSLDSSFPCSTAAPDHTWGGYRKGLVSPYDAGVELASKKIYYEEFQKFFGDINNLYAMERIVNSLPGTLSEKNQMQNYLRIRFYQFALYSNSPEFATVMNQSFKSRTLTLPFASATDFQRIYNSYSKSCDRKISRNDVQVKVTPTSKLKFNKVLQDYYDFGSENTATGEYGLEISGKAEVKIINNGPDLKLRKFSVLNFKLKDKNGKVLGSMSNTSRNTKPTGTNGEVGIYYILPAGTTATYQVDLITQIPGKSAPYGTDIYMSLESLDANNDTNLIIAQPNISSRLFIAYPAPVTPTPAPSISGGVNNLILQN